MADSAVAITAGTGTNIDTVTASTGDHRQIVLIGNKGAHEGFCATFRIPGIAGTAGQKIFALHNATASAVVVDVKSIVVGMYDTVAKVVAPPIIRLWKFTAVPTNGTAVTKVARDSSATATNVSVTAWQGASSDGAASATALTVTLPGGTFISEIPARRSLTLVGQSTGTYEEMVPKGSSVVLRALEGVCVFLDYATATFNPITDMWTVSCNWEEYTV